MIQKNYIVRNSSFYTGVCFSQVNILVTRRRGLVTLTSGISYASLCTVDADHLQAYRQSLQNPVTLTSCRDLMDSAYGNHVFHLVRAMFLRALIEKYFRQCCLNAAGSQYPRCLLPDWVN